MNITTNLIHSHIYSYNQVIHSTSRLSGSHSSPFLHPCHYLPLCFKYYTSESEQSASEQSESELSKSEIMQICRDVEFIYDIDVIYNELRDKHNWLINLDRSEVSLIKNQVSSGLYVLSPLELKVVKRDDFNQYRIDTVQDFPDVQLMDGDNDTVIVIKPSKKEDALVFAALALTLFRLSYGYLENGPYRMIERIYSISDAINDINDMGKVDRLYKITIDIGDLFNRIPICLILNKVKSLVGDGLVYNLIASYLCLPINDSEGYISRRQITNGMPPLGEISRVLFDIVLMDFFDLEFKKRYPGISFIRWYREVFIPTRETDDVNFDEESGYAFLEEAGLVGKIESVGPEDNDTLTCYEMYLVFLDSGNLTIVDA